MAYLRNITAKRLNLSGFRLLSRKRSSTSLPLVYSEEVLCAKSESKPIVALESTIIAHGMPYPQNLETAVQVENIIRQRGAVPATIAILKGQITVGLDEKQLKYLAQAKDVLKASRRDLAPIAATKSNGATTVAGTLVAADLADVPVFVTGGLGGVHRAVENTMDISADLTELGRSKTLVVCSGVKSILDIGRTLEYLETQGVCVCAFGQTTDFPAFYTTRSGFQVPHKVVDAQQAANVLYAAHKLGLSSGTVVAVAVPKEYAMDEKEIEKAIETALDEAKKKGIKGKEITPFILSAVAKITDGASLATNIALIKNNVKVGADIAVEFSKLKNVDNLGSAFNIDGAKGKFSPIFSRKFHTSCLRNLGIGNLDSDSQITPRLKNVEGDVLVIGGANVDRTYRVIEDNIQLDGSTHACLMEQCGGGVGRNMAEALWRLRSGRTRLLTAIGDDNDGKHLMDLAPGLIHEGCVIRDRKTATYAAVLDSRGECKLGLGDMDLHNAISKDMVEKHFKTLQESPMVILDGNVPQSTIDYVLQLCHEMDKPVFFEPTDWRKAVKILQSNFTIDFASPNLLELKAMASFLKPTLKFDENTYDFITIKQLSAIVAKYVKTLVVTIGARGVIVVQNLDNSKSNQNSYAEIRARLYKTNVIDNIKNVSGAGDCFSSGFIHGLLLGLNESQSVSIGFDMSKAALLSKNTVPVNTDNVRVGIEADYILL